MHSIFSNFFVNGYAVFDDCKQMLRKSESFAIFLIYKSILFNLQRQVQLGGGGSLGRRVAMLTGDQPSVGQHPEHGLTRRCKHVSRQASASASKRCSV